MTPSGEPLFRGVAVALVSLFDEDGALQTEACADHAAALVDRGVAAVVLAGSTGEPWFLTGDERLDLLRATRDTVGDRVPLIVGTGHEDPAQAAGMTAAAAEAGADAALALSPPGTEDHRAYYAMLAEAAGAMPVLGYHFPARSAPGIPIEQLAELPIAGLKDSSGSAERLIPEVAAFDGPVWVGSSALLALAGTLGATGAILALANTDPELCISAFEGDLVAQRELIPAHLEIRTDPPHGLKRRLARTSGTSTAVRRALPVAR